MKTIDLETTCHNVVFFFWKHEDIFRGARGKFNRSKGTYFKKPSIAQKVHIKLLSMLIRLLLLAIWGC